MSNKARGPPPQIARCELSQYRDNLRLGKSRRGEAMTERTVDRALGIMRALANEDQRCVVSHPAPADLAQSPPSARCGTCAFVGSTSPRRRQQRSRRYLRMLRERLNSSLAWRTSAITLIPFWRAF